MKLSIALGIAVCFTLAAADTGEMVPPAGPGVFTAKQLAPGTFKLVVAGHTFTSRSDIERYLAYRAARQTIEQKANWFTLKEDRVKGDTVPVPVRVLEGQRFSFRMNYFRPVWRYKVNGSPEWTRWSPFSGAPFISADPKTITDFEVSAEIVVHKGPMDDADPLAYEAYALSDLLVNQVSPPK
jgi:hypothetical protein